MSPPTLPVPPPLAEYGKFACTFLPCPDIQMRFSDGFLSNTAPSTTHLVSVLFDESGSMENYTRTIRTKLKEHFATSGTTPLYVGFSSRTYVSDTLDRVPVQCGSTYIAQAFTAMERAVALFPSLRSVDVVFISDGMDSVDTKPGRLHERMFSLVGIGGTNPFRCSGFIHKLRTRFITIGVGEGFPTSVVFPRLRDEYQSSANICTSPTILPFQDICDATQVFADLATILAQPLEDSLWRTLDASGLPMIGTGERVTPDRAEALGAALMSVCMSRVVGGRGTGVVVESLESTRRILLDTQRRLGDLAAQEESEEAVAVRDAVGSAGVNRALASPKRNYPRMRRAQAMTMFVTLQTRVNELLCQARVDDHFAHYSNYNLAKIMSWCNQVHPKLMAKALKYRAADIAGMVENLNLTFALMPDEGFPEDRDCECKISLATQAELLVDARDDFLELNLLEGGIRTIADVAAVLPVVGFPVTIRRLAGATMNEWMAWVESMDTVLDKIALSSLHTAGHVMRTRDVVSNAIVPVGSPKLLATQVCHSVFCDATQASLCFL